MKACLGRKDCLAQPRRFLVFTWAGKGVRGATLEEQLRKMAAKSGVAVVDATNGQPRKASALNADLYSKVNAYSKPEHAQVDAWQKIRNDAAHGDPNFEQQHNDADIRRMFEGIRDFIVKQPA
jgi:hypothetical protein